MEDYELIEEIGRGGMGVVYRARQRSRDRVVALKTMLGGARASSEFARLFRAEAAATARLAHPNIVAMHDFGVHEGWHYLVLDLIEGLNLARFLEEREASPRMAAECLKTVAEAVHHAHERGILHRDLEPSNILIDAHGQPHVVDFGLAGRLDGGSGIPVAGHAHGSPSYMPPELALACRAEVDRRIDVYSLGATLFHMLTGRPPFVGGTRNAILVQVIGMEPLAPRTLNAAVPPDLETICMTCLEKDPARRYPTAHAVAKDLSRFLRGEPIQARPVGVVGKLRRWWQSGGTWRP